MPAILTSALIVLAAVWFIGWVLACVIDITIARWPEAATLRRTVPPTPVRWARLLYLWPLSLRAVLTAGRPRAR